jgi:capsule polysaccharide export protein KpsE/RkpR
LSTLHTELGSDATGNETRDARKRVIIRLRLFWDARKLLFGVFVLGALVSLGFALLIPSRYEATTQLMPPDGQSSSGMAMLSALAGRAGGVGGVAGDLLGVKNSGALFVGILESRTVQDRLVEQFDLRHLYHAGKMEDARAGLAAHTRITEDRKSGIIAVTATDQDPRLAAAMAQAYVDELDRLVEQVSTSSARRERIFLEERLRAVKLDLDSAARRFSIFASKNTAIDIPAQSKAMVEAAATLEGQLIASEAELHGLEAMYTEQNVRVRALRARVTELRAQLGKMGGERNFRSSVLGNGCFALSRDPPAAVAGRDVCRFVSPDENSGNRLRAADAAI